MALRYVEYKRRQWVLKFRDPWSNKPRVRSFLRKPKPRLLKPLQMELYALRTRAYPPRASAHVFGVGNARDSRGAFGAVHGNP